MEIERLVSGIIVLCGTLFEQAKRQRNSSTKSEKELRLISKNREALDKRDEIIAM